MLTSLRIENFAIVAKLELHFSSGLTTFTGETGAGKSIMIDALMLALGGRADVSVIRPNTEKCDISATFVIDKHPSVFDTATLAEKHDLDTSEETPLGLCTSPALWLQEHEVSHDDQEVILRRVIYPEGRSKSFINGQPFPLQKVKELSEMLVDIHGQHQHQSLLNHATHRQQLDQYAHHAALLTEVAQLFREAQHKLRAIDALKNQDTSLDHAQLLQFQWEELSALQVEPEEIEQLHVEHQRLHHAQDYLTKTQAIIDGLNAEEGMSVRQNLHHLRHLLDALPQNDSAIRNARELVENALIQCDEALDEVTRFYNQLSLDPERLHAVETRMSLLHQMARKYHMDVHDLPQQVTRVEQSLQALQQREQRLIQLQQDYALTWQAYLDAAARLSFSRQQAASKMAEEISEVIRSLGMPKGFMTVVVSPLEKGQSHGLDKVEYQVCTNPGMLPDVLSKIASGGELSRISLAIQMITAQRASTPTLLFDEVDVGIGGATAALVGQMLRKLGARLQIFCVTHQPQVAACAHHHFRVEKYTEDSQTFSRVVALASSAQVDEIARMLGGLSITEQTKLHAQSLLAESVT